MAETQKVLAETLENTEYKHMAYPSSAAELAVFRRHYERKNAS